MTVSDERIISAVPVEGIGIERLVEKLNEGRRGAHSLKAAIRASVRRLIEAGTLQLRKLGRGGTGGRVLPPQSPKS